ncbi:hypothetical protein E1B28_008742 [Marasmius oreades]|uniref:Uncharacterized protein n=1 Tax=Marasmius oreades TaxID=181124 RepID=A0A9P7RZ58_9AGAR|nr:uncharacterized protein E1B28_008742 [Marasmius oreades]KAG7092385.1 hypothetical protein E1B28_008742 [Marasmius oreades]
MSITGPPPACPQCPPGSPLITQECSLVCTNCGHVLEKDPSFIDPEPSNLTPHSSLLKSSRSSWNLAGQNKEVTHRRNIYLINEFIKSLAHAFSVPGIAPRAITLFTQAMSTGQFSWGNKAKVIAGVCLSIALRESHRPDFLADISSLVEQRLTHMKRSLASVLSVLGIILVPSVPQQHLTTLHSHLISILESSQQEQDQLPFSLVSELKPLSIRSAEETARSLTDLLARASSYSDPLGYAATPTACAVFILSLEAEARATLSNLSHLAACFAARFNIGKGIVMRCYKSLQDELVRWSEELNWLDAYDSKRGRAKVAKRLLVARALKDLITWKDDIWRQKITVSGCLAIAECSKYNDDSETPLVEKSEKSLEEGPSRKRRKLNHTIGDAAHFLVDPLIGPIPHILNFHSTPTDSPEPQDTFHPKPEQGRKIPDVLHQLPLTHWLLASSAPIHSVRRLPSRLQLLAVARGGSSSEEITDSELLTDDEWETIRRTSPEIEELLEQWRLDGTLEHIQAEPHKSRKSKGVAEPNVGGKETKSKRINFDAFEQFMGCEEENPQLSAFMGIESVEHLEWVNFADVDDEVLHPESTNVSILRNTAEGEVIDDWHPMSPIGGYASDRDCD